MRKIKISFSDFWGGFDSNNNFWLKIFEDLNIDYEIVPNDSDLLISSCFGFNWRNKNYVKKIFWTGENWFRMDSPIDSLGGKNILQCFDKVYSFDYNKNSNHYRLPLYLINYLENNHTVFDNLRKKSKDELFVEFKNRKFCTFFHRNGQSEFRNYFFNELNKIELVDSYGPLFNNTGNRNISWYDKIDISRGYKFSHCFENSEYEGYVTEKIMDAFRSDTIPIYWGGSKVHLDFNTKSFINVHEHGVKNSLELIKNMNKDFDLYWSYYSEPIVSEHQKPLDIRVNEFKNNLKQFFIDNRFLG